MGGQVGWRVAAAGQAAGREVSGVRAEVVRVRGLSKAAARSPRLGVEPYWLRSFPVHGGSVSDRGGGGRHPLTTASASPGLPLACTKIGHVTGCGPAAGHLPHRPARSHHATRRGSCTAAS